MISSAIKSVSHCYKNHVEPVVKWTEKNAKLVAAVALAIILGVVCLNNPKAYEVTGRSMKFLTIVIPLAYTLPAPFLGVAVGLGQATPHSHMRHDLVSFYESYCKSIVKVWKAWLSYVSKN